MICQQGLMVHGGPRLAMVDTKMLRQLESPHGSVRISRKCCWVNHGGGERLVGQG